MPDDRRWVDEQQEDRYRHLLEEFGKFATESQQYRHRTEQALAEMKDQLNTYWKATASGMRQLADWFAATEDDARKERTAERHKRNVRDSIMIALLLIAILVGGYLIWAGS